MASPFPGMNPYLEREEVWQDFHQSFIPLAREVLSAQVRPDYIVKVEEQIFIHEVESEPRRLFGRADVSVSGAGGWVAPESGVALQVAPAYGRLPALLDVERHAYLEIRDRQNRELITVLELLSPSNKRPGADREQYLAKRRQLVASSVHLVEVDLLRGGPRLPIEGLPSCEYCALVSRAQDRPRVALWPVRLRDPLPTIPIPLRSPDNPAQLDLQAILGRLYDAAGYEDYLYDGLPQPPLSPEDAAWAEALVRRVP